MSKYVLALHNNDEKLKIQINSKTYYIYVDNRSEIFFNPNNDFKLKEKLYILNYPLDVIWIPISEIKYKFFKIFYSFIKPKHLVIKPNNGKVTIKINRLL